MFGKTDPLRQLAIINARVNGSRGGLTPLRPGDPDFGGDRKWDCEDYAETKKFAPDWPVDEGGQAIAAQDYNVTLPNGELHRIVTATVGGKEYVLDNYSGNALLTRADWERGGWKFAPFQAQALHTKPTGATGPNALK